MKRRYLAWAWLAVLLMCAAPTWAQLSSGQNESLYDPRQSVYIQEEFMSGVNTNGQGGALGWGQAGTVTGIASTANRIGIIRIDTGAASGTPSRINLGQMSATSAVIDPSTNVFIRWMTRLNTNDVDTTVRIGAANSTSGAPPNDGIYFEKAAADTNWFCVTRASSTQTKTDTGIAVDTNFHTFSWRRDGYGVTCLIDYVPVVPSQSSNIPTVFLAPFSYIINSAPASKTMDIDYFELRLTGLVR